MKIRERECGSLLTKSRLPDADYVINSYIGCCHGCIYCYAQFMKRFTGHADEAWGSFMDVKVGGRISQKAMEGKTVLFGSVTDPYNPLEKKYLATRKILEHFAGQKCGADIEILTKSPLVLRDIGLLKELRHVRVGISLSTMDRDFARRIETHTVSPEERIKAVRTLHSEGISVYVFVSPIFPLFSGWKDVVDAAGDDADMLCFENLNLRANYRTAVFDMVRQFYPEKYGDFTALFADKKSLKMYWEQEAKAIEEYVVERPHKLYFFHEEIRK